MIYIDADLKNADWPKRTPDVFFRDGRLLGGPGSGRYPKGSGGGSKISKERQLDVKQYWMEGWEGPQGGGGGGGEPELYGKMRDPDTIEGKEFQQVAEMHPEITGTFYRGLALSQADFDKLNTETDFEMTKHSSASTNKAVASNFVGGGSTEFMDDAELAQHTAAVPVQVMLKIIGTGRDFAEPDSDYPEKEVVLLAGKKYKRVGKAKQIKFDEIPGPDEGGAVIWEITYKEVK